MTLFEARIVAAFLKTQKPTARAHAMLCRVNAEIMRKTLNAGAIDLDHECLAALHMELHGELLEDRA